MRVRTDDRLEERTDADLVEAVRTGDVPAFEALYRRHADAAWRVGCAVAGNAHDAADAVSEAFTKVFAALPAGRLDDATQFRSYLLSATRNAAIDAMRKSGRARPTDRMHESPINTGPTEIVLDGENSRLVAQAFRDLPERWRSVLWLTEVEGIPAREVAARLGLSPNGAAQLAVRARAGLRERFLQAHLRADVGSACRYTVDRLGAYVAGKLSPRELAKVDQHLAGCEPCCERRDELEDVGSSLRRIIIPLPLLLGPSVVSRFKEISAASAVTNTASGIPWSGLASKLQKPLLAASSATFALGVITATVMGTPDAPLRATPPAVPAQLPAAATEPEVAAPAIETVQFRPAARELPIDFDPSGFQTEAAAAPTTTTTGAPTTTTAPTTTVPAARSDDPGPAPTTDPEPIAEAALTVAVGPIGAGISLGAGSGACVGVEVYGVGRVGCAPEQPETVDDDSNDVEVSVETDGSELGPLDDRSVTVGLP